VYGKLLICLYNLGKLQNLFPLVYTNLVWVECERMDFAYIAYVNITRIRFRNQLVLSNTRKAFLLNETTEAFDLYTDNTFQVYPNYDLFK